MKTTKLSIIGERMKALCAAVDALQELALPFVDAIENDYHRKTVPAKTKENFLRLRRLLTKV